MENIAIYDNKDFVELVAQEGYVITTYKEGDDKITFGKKVSLPKDSSTDGFYSMEEEKAIALANDFNEKNRAKREAEREARRKELNASK